MSASDDDSSPSGAFKDWFNPARYRLIADQLAAAEPRFDRRRFLRLTCHGLEERSLVQRLHQTAIAAEAALPGTYADKLRILEAAANGQPPSFIGIWFSEFAGRFGTSDPGRALAALRHFTRYGSAEFAIRPYILREPDATLATMLEWTHDPDEHVRRLASEGSRPRLPWGLRLGFLIKDPAPTRAILEALKADPALYVRKSVANHLNDLAKDHPDYVVELVSDWDRSHPHTAWIVRHGLRTLVKRGHAAALNLLGAGAAPVLRVRRFRAQPASLVLGDHLELVLELESTASRPQALIIDYVVHYVKASGASSPKVFKWKQIELSARARLAAVKRQLIQDLTTRRHYPGRHRVTLQINGRALAETAFTLR